MPIEGGLYAEAFKRGLRPEDPLRVSEWSDKYRVLSSKASAEPGPWRTSRVPYLQELMDCLSPHSPIERVVGMFSAQSGKSEAGNNWLGYIMHHAPGPVMLINPTVDTVKRTSKHRIGPLIEESAVLRNLVKSPRSRDSGNTVFEKEFPGGILIMTGANSAVGLRGSPIRYLFLDEIDGYPPDADGEGDPISLAIQRTANFPNRKILMVSTPTIKGFSRIETAYLESDQRRYWVPCPKCGEFQVLEWQTGDRYNVKWHHGDRQQAYYECIFCHYEIQNHEKNGMLPRGEWRAEAPGDGQTAGFHLNGLYAPHGWTSWGDIAVEHGRVYKDPLRLKVWVNTKLAETWEEDAERMDGEALMERREMYGPLLPEGVAVLTAGVDIQDDRIEMEVLGIGADEETWSIDYRVIQGDPSTLTPWRDLDALLARKFPHSKAVPDLIIRAACVDTGGHHTLKTYEFCRARQRRRIWAIKGRGGQGVPIWPRRPSKKNKGGVPLFILGVDALKEAVYSRLRLKEPGPGYCH